MSVDGTRYRRGVINEKRAKVSGMCDIPNSSYLAKGITENYSVYYGDAMAAGNQWKHLEFNLPLSKRSFSLLNLNTFT